MGSLMPTRLKRYYGQGHLHFLTFSCYQRRPLLDSPIARTFFLSTLDEIRNRYHFKLHGYVVMPEHLHLLLSEPPEQTISVALKALKQRISRDFRGGIPESNKSSLPVALRTLAIDLPRFWEPRFYDFNVYTRDKLTEKLKYMHANPVNRGLVEHPAAWIGSSYLFYETGEQGMILIDPPS
jgi:REP-associated tyrosine transposase